MEFVVAFVVLVIVFVVLYLMMHVWRYTEDLPTAVVPPSDPTVPNPSAPPNQEPEDDPGELMGLLPAVYYFLAVFCGIVLLGFTAVNSDELNSTQIGAWIGYTIGSVLSILAVGRVIELLQQIRDAVRS